MKLIRTAKTRVRPIVVAEGDMDSRLSISSRDKGPPILTVCAGDASDHRYTIELPLSDFYGLVARVDSLRDSLESGQEGVHYEIEEKA